METTMKLTEEEVAQAIAEHLTRKGIRVKEVTLNVGTAYEDRPCGSSYPIFKNAEVEVDLENPLSQLEIAGH